MKNNISNAIQMINARVYNLKNVDAQSKSIFHISLYSINFYGTCIVVNIRIWKFVRVYAVSN